MLLLASLGALILAASLIVREYQLMRERTLQEQAYEQLRQALEGTRHQLRRACEDLYVLQSVLTERNVVCEAELSQGHFRLVEMPRKMARERIEAQGAGASYISPVIIEESENKIH